jgi:hypothetical protein
VTPARPNARSGASSAGGTNPAADPLAPYRKLQAVAAAADDDPLVLIDVAWELLGYANRRASEGRCTQAEWIAAQHRLARMLVDSIACWKETSWHDVLDVLAARLEVEHFEDEVLTDIWKLPEIET